MDSSFLTYDTISHYPSPYLNISISLKVFLFRCYEFLGYSVSLARLGTSFIYIWIDGTSKIVLLLGFVFLSFSGRLLSMYLHEINNILEEKKKENSNWAYCSLADR